VFWECFGSALGVLWECFGSALGVFRECFGSAPDSTWQMNEKLMGQRRFRSLFRRLTEGLAGGFGAVFWGEIVTEWTVFAGGDGIRGNAALVHQDAPYGMV
jgi:hypothetical protein